MIGIQIRSFILGKTWAIAILNIYIIVLSYVSYEVTARKVTMVGMSSRRHLPSGRCISSFPNLHVVYTKSLHRSHRKLSSSYSKSVVKEIPMVVCVLACELAMLGIIMMACFTRRGLSLLLIDT
ncbi:uncharacterized protein F4812DRAFT_265841 [Daldinia caldariorum]|uniref:uncharacterized protein n=1 Tax=Daldinia caldariorum TaxID=326644 RepID=UPI002007C107|nr:uncharacterized protein F4812DRAFT_265841 [Daldinia caldariorum]KAI1470432.1 hypothetical protein F4812DRAFT_265841 [Daldinia caldariorum]